MTSSSECSQPTVTPFLLFSVLSQSSRGAKYSRMASVSILGSPVITSMASFQGREAPRVSISFSLLPASTEP